MGTRWKIYMLAAVSFLVGTSEYMIAGILDKIAADFGVTLSAAGQLMTAFSLAYAIGTPILMAATARLNVTDYINYYNSERCQWTLKKMTPDEFRGHLFAS